MGKTTIVLAPCILSSGTHSTKTFLNSMPPAIGIPHLDLENKLQTCLDVTQNRVKGFAQRKDTFSLAATKLSLWTEQRIDVKYDT